MFNVRESSIRLEEESLKRELNSGLTLPGSCSLVYLSLLVKAAGLEPPVWLFIELSIY